MKLYGNYCLTLAGLTSALLVGRLQLGVSGWLQHFETMGAAIHQAFKVSANNFVFEGAEAITSRTCLMDFVTAGRLPDWMDTKSISSAFWKETAY